MKGMRGEGEAYEVVCYVGEMQEEGYGVDEEQGADFLGDLRRAEEVRGYYAAVSIH